MDVSFSNEFSEAIEGFTVITIEADVDNTETSAELSAEIDRVAEEVARTMTFADIKSRPAIAATRAAYKALGKDPNRYRPAAEQLCRRVVKGQGLYRVNALVDLINVLSIESGYSIGGFDRDKIEGDKVTIGVGRHDEPYEGIGRGALNIEFLPVWRDATGGIGTPTSDNERTKIDLSTKHLFMTVNIYAEEMPPAEFIARAESLLVNFCGASSVNSKIHKQG